MEQKRTPRTRSWFLRNLSDLVSLSAKTKTPKIRTSTPKFASMPTKVQVHRADNDDETTQNVINVDRQTYERYVTAEKRRMAMEEDKSIIEEVEQKINSQIADITRDISEAKTKAQKEDLRTKLTMADIDRQNIAKRKIQLNEEINKLKNVKIFEDTFEELDEKGHEDSIRVFPTEKGHMEKKKDNPYVMKQSTNEPTQDLPENVLKIVKAAQTIYQDLDNMENMKLDKTEIFVFRAVINKFKKTNELFHQRLYHLYDFRDMEANENQRILICAVLEQLEDNTFEEFLAKAEFDCAHEENLMKKEQNYEQKKFPKVDNAKIKLDYFDGDLCKYRAFMEKFTNFVEKDPKYDDTAKMETLISLLKGKPKEIFGVYSSSGMNFKQLKKDLEVHYGDKRRILNALIDKMEEIKPSSENVDDIFIFVHCLDNLNNEAKIIASSMGAINNEWSLNAKRALTRNLPQGLKEDIAIYADIYFDVESFENCLAATKKTLLKLKAAKKQPNNTGIKFQTAAAVVSTYQKSKNEQQKKRIYGCLFCKNSKQHSIFECPKSPDVKLQHLQNENRCFGCLKKMDYWKVHKPSCTKWIKCNNCSLAHLTDLCGQTKKYFEDISTKQQQHNRQHASGNNQLYRNSTYQQRFSQNSSSPRPSAPPLPSKQVSPTPKTMSSSGSKMTPTTQNVAAIIEENEDNLISKYSQEQLNNLMFAASVVASVKGKNTSDEIILPIINSSIGNILMDSGSMLDFISTKKARELKLPITRIIELNLGTFGQKEAAKVRRPVCKLKINDDLFIEVIVCNDLLAEIDITSHPFVKMKDNKCTVDIILGAKTWPRFVQSINKLNGTLLEIKTIFGPTAMGISNTSSNDQNP